MANQPCIQEDGPLPWLATHCAVTEDLASETRHGPLRVSMLHHPGYPYPGTAHTTTLEKDLQGIAFGYLGAAAARAGIDLSFVNALNPERKPRTEFRWLPLFWGIDASCEADKDPRHSFWVARQYDRAGLPRPAPLDRTAVLLAGPWICSPPGPCASEGASLGGEMGLRIVMHVGPATSAGQCPVRVTTLSLSGPLHLPLPQMAASINGIDIEALTRQGSFLHQYWLGTESLSITGVRAESGPSEGVRYHFFGALSRSLPHGRTGNYAYVYRSGLAPGLIETEVQVERLSHATPCAMQRDPASCGPSRTLRHRLPTQAAGRLDAYRLPTACLPKPDTEGRSHLESPGSRFEVRQNVLGNPGGCANRIQAIDLALLPLRSDHLAAAHAYLRADELFRRFDAYGLRPQHYFKSARLPLVLRHRAPLKGAPDGRAVNAQVRPDGIDPPLFQDWSKPDQRAAWPQLEVSFGAANLMHRLVAPTDHGDHLRAQYLGLAADPRWAWHEFGHVLNFASFGELEFRFAHSAGDALAAIVADPDSRLAWTTPAAATPDLMAQRGKTFPWVFIGRRHDRDPDHGWCMCAPRSRPFPEVWRDRRLGYFGEQLLSSALFRLYCCIGGDTAGTDRVVRRNASDYAVYLVMRAIALLGPERVVPARTFAQFAAAVVDADAGTRAWSIRADWPDPAAPRRVQRVGGCLPKVIRWAFEAQGLYADTALQETGFGAGKPPCVDVFIADARQPGATADGGYHPVPLLWDVSSDQPWHASAAGIALERGKLVVRVRNRGALEAEAVQVRAWASPAVQGAGSARRWTPLAVQSRQPQAVPTASATAFSFDAPPRKGRWLVRAVATCPADRATVDPYLGNRLAGRIRDGQLLVDVIANDNNQGLRVIRV